MTRESPVINIYSPKGGNGTTTLACLLAFKFADTGNVGVPNKKVLIVSSDPQEVRAVLGMAMGVHDVRAVVSRDDVVELKWESSTARCIDAGLLASRQPATANALYQACLEKLGWSGVAQADPLAQSFGERVSPMLDNQETTE